ncbi:DNA-3-methyladenine glycosylase II [Pseudorhizobium tarimense]|uniref:DNA-3-methyladenine glycosylase II n=1 Tax=Pseudorhizobium tarimense TaxID=1079109 RepID=A0ABV2H962_9HYPH|nr:DNA-3-methyladenine glycosylase 2 family protein [Pseudorhizobium tarimense]MCJ8520290.1 DNA-3-methyladenine glycosylase 2 family protein [Pseudorhizobium tarimense]
MRRIRGDDDLQMGLQHLLEADPRLISISELAGPLPLRLMEPGFAGLAFIIVSQMISKASASAIWGRMSAAGPVAAEAWLDHSPDVIAGFGLSRAKTMTLARLATTVARSDIDLNGICDADPPDAMAELMALPGIGPWTAEVYLMVCAGHPDIFPSGDVALQAALARALLLPERPAPRAVALISEAWRPWRSVAARLFWAYYSATAHKDVAPVLPAA